MWKHWLSGATLCKDLEGRFPSCVKMSIIRNIKNIIVSFTVRMFLGVGTIMIAGEAVAQELERFQPIGRLAVGTLRG